MDDMPEPIEPRALPELRSFMLDYAETGGAEWFWNLHISRSGNTYGLEPRQAAQAWASDEIRRLREAELFHVAQPMCDLVGQAAPALPEYSLAPFDLPAPVGMCVWQDPRCLDVEGRTQAATWSPARGIAERSPDNPGGDGVWITWYERRDLAIRAIFQESDQPEIQAALVGLPFVLIGKALVPFNSNAAVKGRLGDELIEESPDVEHVFARLRALFTTWRLMQDKVSVSSEVHADRAARRRLQRASRPTTPVRVISLRTVSGMTSSGGSREYQHRWVVKGHWRMQAVGPGRSLRRPTWVLPHVKGPDGAPLIGGEKVYTLRR